MMQTKINEDAMAITEPEQEEHTVSFKVKCYATYKSSLTLPNEFFRDGKQIVSDDEILNFVRTHLPDANVCEPEFLDDLEDVTDAVWQEDIREVI